MTANNTGSIRKTGWLILLSLLLTACVSPTAQQPNISLTEQAEKLAKLDQWAVDGKVAFRSPQGNNSGYLFWQQKADNYFIRIHGPLGQGNTEVTGSDTGVIINSGDKILQSDSATELLYQHTGWLLPVKQLRYWVKGQAAPNLPITTITQDVYITHLQQHGWDISYSKFKSFDGLWLPGKITITKDEHTAIILAKQWTTAL